MAANIGPLPAGYRWTITWDTSRGLFGVMIGVFLFALALCGIGRIPPYYFISMASASLFLMVGSLQSGRLAAEVVDDAIVVGYRAWASPLILANGLVLLYGFEMTWGGCTGIAPDWFTYGGLTVVVILGPIVLFHLTFLRRNKIFITRRMLRIVQGRFDWEFKWSAISSVAAKNTSNPAPVIAIMCPVDLVVNHSGNTRLLQAKESEDEWAVQLSCFSVDPNSLLSTLEFMVNNPRGHRRELTAAHLIAMLTPPD